MSKLRYPLDRLRLVDRNRLLQRSELLARSDVLRDVYERQLVTDEAGNDVTERVGIQFSYAEALYQLVLARRPRTVVEIGMANGISSLAILTGLQDNGDEGRLISIDPHQTSGWRGIGVLQVQRAGLESLHTLIEEPNYLALPDLVRANTQVDLAYIDGWHTFDYTLLDWWFLDKMMQPGSVVGLNDCGYRAVHRVISFFRTHRKYRELDGLMPGYLLSQRFWSAMRRLTGWTTTDRYFEKTESWEPNWNFYSSF